MHIAYSLILITVVTQTMEATIILRVDQPQTNTDTDTNTNTDTNTDTDSDTDTNTDTDTDTIVRTVPSGCLSNAVISVPSRLAGSKDQ